jgi:hypothetical protein
MTLSRGVVTLLQGTISLGLTHPLPARLPGGTKELILDPANNTSDKSELERSTSGIARLDVASLGTDSPGRRCRRYRPRRLGAGSEGKHSGARAPSGL